MSEFTSLLLSLIFGLTMSGFFFTRFMSVVQRSVNPTQIGYAGAVALAAFYMPRDRSPAGSSASWSKPPDGRPLRFWWSWDRRCSASY